MKRLLLLTLIPFLMGAAAIGKISGLTWGTSSGNSTKINGIAAGSTAGTVNKIGGIDAQISASGYSDSFTGSDGTALATHDAQWTSMPTPYLTTYATLQSNQLSIQAYQNGGAYYAASTADTSQMVFKGVTANNTVTKRVHVRAGGSTKGYEAGIAYPSSGSTVSSFAIRKGGVFLATITGSNIDTSADHTIKLVASGTSTVTLTVYVDGSSYGTTSDSSSTITSGSPGWSCDGGSNATYNRFDDWQDH